MDMGPLLRELAQEQNLDATLGNAGFFLIDFATGTARPSRLMRDLGYSENDYLKNFEERLHPEDRAAISEQWSLVAEGARNGFHAEFRVRDKSGSWRWVLSHGTVLTRDGNHPSLNLGIDLDVTDSKTTEASVRAQLHDVETIFHQAESLRVASLLANSTQDLGKTIELVLAHAQDLLKSHATAVSMYRDGVFTPLGSQGEPVDETHPRPLNHPLWSVAEGRSPVVRDDLKRGLLTKTPKPRFRSWMGIPLIFGREFLGVIEFWHRDPRFFRSEQIWPAMGFADSIAESVHTARVFETLRDDTRTDALTGLLTRRYLHDSGAPLVDGCLSAGQPVALLFIDIDFFKDINDKHGHLVGDAVLMTVAQLFRSLLRKDDRLFRYGGEEFVALLPEADPPLAEKIAERLRQTAADARFRGLDKPVTVSIGVVPITPGHRVVFEQALEEADQAMYRAKQGGRDQVMTSDRWLRTDF
jgi:diguanylate cyclase (GGDEF)-like protein/PAS domain S-box-containing protein